MIKEVVSIKNISKIYPGNVTALDNVSLEIHKGEVFGLLGPNGAGKTTLINIIAGLTNKSSGHVSVLGKDVIKDYQFTRSKIGLVQQELNADFFFTVQEIVDIQGGYFGIDKKNNRTEEILRKLSLWDKRNAVGRTLSGGMKRRVMIAKALIHNPEILFLDEPTAGVDVQLRNNLWELIRDLKKECKTIILTTHYLEEAEALSDRIGIIDHGKLVLVEGMQKLLKDHGTTLHNIYLSVLEKNNNAE